MTGANTTIALLDAASRILDASLLMVAAMGICDMTFIHVDR